jgi:RNA polymerase sigma-70 factor (ECF subfamily)
MATEERDAMTQGDWLGERFEAHRGHLRAIAYRILGSASDADDAVQEAWLRFSRSDTSAVDNLGSWLTTVVSRVCLNMLQARRSRPLPTAGLELPEPEASPTDSDPEYQAVLADSVGLALLVVLDRLTPAERVAFVLHDVFAIPFDQIAPILDRSLLATRQLASRARARVQHQDASQQADTLRQAALVDAFLAAAHKGDFRALLALLDPEVVLYADEHAATLGARIGRETRGAEPVAALLRQARGAEPVFVDGAPAVAWMPGGRPRVVLVFTTRGDKITAIEAITDPDRLAQLELVPS